MNFPAKPKINKLIFQILILIEEFPDNYAIFAVFARSDKVNFIQKLSKSVRGRWGTISKLKSILPY